MESFLPYKQHKTSLRSFLFQTSYFFSYHPSIFLLSLHAHTNQHKHKYNYVHKGIEKGLHDQKAIFAEFLAFTK